MNLIPNCPLSTRSILLSGALPKTSPLLPYETLDLFEAVQYPTLLARGEQISPRSGESTSPRNPFPSPPQTNFMSFLTSAAETGALPLHVLIPKSALHILIRERRGAEMTNCPWGRRAILKQVLLPNLIRCILLVKKAGQWREDLEPRRIIASLGNRMEAATFVPAPTLITRVAIIGRRSLAHRVNIFTRRGMDRTVVTCRAYFY